MIELCSEVGLHFRLLWAAVYTPAQAMTHVYLAMTGLTQGTTPSLSVTQ